MENNNTSNKRTYYISIAILAGMFFIFGFVSWVNSILIPYFRISCELTHFESYFVAFAFYIAYFVMAVPSGILLKRVGFKRGIMYGFMLTALGAFIFVPTIRNLSDRFVFHRNRAGNPANSSQSVRHHYRSN